VTIRRVLVTGSRCWPWPGTVCDALTDQRARLGAGDTLIVVVGFDPKRHTPRGVDRFAYEWAHHHEVLPAAEGQACVVAEPHPADWDSCGPGCVLGDTAHRRAAARAAKLGRPVWCPRAGRRRNGEMVAAGADVALAFCLDDSPGTLDCMGRAKAARIPMITWQFYSPT
jgi:hypothetical protein